MNKETLKNLTEAHSWLGVIISGVLMIVFACGTASFFRENIIVWDKHYNPEKVRPEGSIKLDQVSQYVLKNYTGIPDDHDVFIGMPRQDLPYYRVFFEIEKPIEKPEKKLEESSELTHENIRLFLDAESIEPIKDASNQHFLGNMLYRLHINLMIPYGQEIVGIVSLLFFVILISGVLIHLKKIIKHYYLYRLNKPRDTFLDGHNFIGVTTLPYTFIYALTGVMFNLSLVFQAGFGYAVFQGDIDKLIETAGFTSGQKVEKSGEPMRFDSLEEIYHDAQTRYPGFKPNFFNIDGFGDKNATVSVTLDNKHRLTSRATLVYQIEDKKIIEHHTPDRNAFFGTYSVLENLHFGYFGGITMQFIYFILGLGCCYLIITGNLVWLEKREKNKKQSRISLRIVKSLTLTLSAGTLIAISLSFVATRFAPTSIERADFLHYVFYAGWFGALIHSFFSNHARNCLEKQLFLCAFLFSLCPIYDLVQYLIRDSSALSSNVDVFIVNLCLGLFSIFSFTVARYHKRSYSSKSACEIA